MIPVPGFVNCCVVRFKAHYEEIDQDVEQKEHLHEDEEGPVNGNHIEGELNENACGRQSRQQVPHYLVVITYVDKELA